MKWSSCLFATQFIIGVLIQMMGASHYAILFFLKNQPCNSV